MLAAIIALLVVIVGAFLAFVATRPSEFRVTRSASMAAPPAAVFAQINDFHKWEAWSPWAKLDPNAKNTFEGSASGQGAVFKWEGDNKVGAGIMTITESHPGDLVRINLEFLRPFKATNLTEFTFAPKGDQTVVTWTMSGRNNFIGKAISLFMDCDKMVGSQFETGLASIKKIVETPAR